MKSIPEILESIATAQGRKTTVKAMVGPVVVILFLAYMAALTASAWGSVAFYSTFIPNAAVAVFLSLLTDIAFSTLFGLGALSIRKISRKPVLSFFAFLLSFGVGFVSWMTSTGGQMEFAQMELAERFDADFQKHVSDSTAAAAMFEAKIDSLRGSNAVAATKAVTAQNMAVIEGNNAQIAALTAEKAASLNAMSRQFWTATGARGGNRMRYADRVTSIIKYSIVLNLAISLSFSMILISIFNETEEARKLELQQHEEEIQKIALETNREMDRMLLETLRRRQSMISSINVSGGVAASGKDQNPPPAFGAGANPNTPAVGANTPKKSRPRLEIIRPKGDD